MEEYSNPPLARLTFKYNEVNQICITLSSCFGNLTSMEISALLYFSCWSLISITFLGLGFDALNRDDDDTKISPSFMFLFSRLLAIFVCHSSTYALIHRCPRANSSLITHLKVSVSAFTFPLYAYIVSGPIPFKLTLCYACLAVIPLLLFMNSLGIIIPLYVDFFVRAMVLSFGVSNDRFFGAFVLITAFLTAGAASSLDFSFPDQKERPRIVGIVGYIVASLVFNFFVKFSSFSHVVAFSCFAVALLGSIAMAMPRLDLGVLDLLITNILIGCSNGFGLTGPTWFAFVAATLLYILNSKLKTVRLVQDHDVILW